MADSFSKKEQQKKKAQKKKEKQAKKEARQANKSAGGSLDDMLAYVDEYGRIVDTPPDESKKKEIKAEDIDISVPKSEDIEEEDFELKGRVSFFNEGKNYGFIKDKNSNESYFVHANNCVVPISEGDNVSFKIEKSPKGFIAVDVKKD